jgi:hypothetical protein
MRAAVIGGLASVPEGPGGIIALVSQPDDAGRISWAEFGYGLE